MAHAPRKLAKQSRSRATSAAIVEAAARILETAGADGLTTNRIAERAGVSIGSLYQYFPDKKAVLAALLRREWEDLEARIREAGADTDDPRAAISRIVDIALAHQFARPRLALELEYLERGLDLDDEMAALASRLAEAVERAVAAYRPDTDATAAADVVTICRALINEAALRGDVAPKDLKARVMRAVFGYLEA